MSWHTTIFNRTFRYHGIPVNFKSITSMHIYVQVENSQNCHIFQFNWPLWFVFFSIFAFWMQQQQQSCAFVSEQPNSLCICWENDVFDKKNFKTMLRWRFSCTTLYNCVWLMIKKTTKEKNNKNYIVKIHNESNLFICIQRKKERER